MIGPACVPIRDPPRVPIRDPRTDQKLARRCWGLSDPGQRYPFGQAKDALVLTNYVVATHPIGGFGTCERSDFL